MQQKSVCGVIYEKVKSSGTARAAMLEARKGEKQKETEARRVEKK